MTPLKVYLAGKIKKNCWRHDIVPGLKTAWDGDYKQHMVLAWPEKFAAMRGGHTYVGPYFVNGDQHMTYHGPNEHGVASQSKGNYEEEQIYPASTITRCLAAITKANVVFVWIEPEEINGADWYSGYGTLFELGFAAAQAKRVVIAMPREFSDIWFAAHFAELVIVAHNAVDGWDKWCAIEEQMTTPRFVRTQLLEILDMGESSDSEEP